MQTKNTEGENIMNQELFWQVFEMSGNIDAYLAYKGHDMAALSRGRGEDSPIWPLVKKGRTQER
jgi:hypothetical protein